MISSTMFLNYILFYLKEFTTGSVMNFLMSTTVYLGDLEYIRIWHDNSGSGNFASWYLSKIEIHDVQRNES